MLHLALAALLAGSPGTGDLAAPVDEDKDAPLRTEATVGLTAADDDAIILDTYAFGQAEPTFINIWAGFGWANVDEAYDHAGNTQGMADITFMRAFLGTQINLIRTPGLTFGVGGQLMIGSTDVDGVGDSGFGLHSLKLFGQVRGRVLGLHGGYILDLDDPAEGEVAITDGLDAWFIGFNFDYQPSWLRLFGGVDVISFIDHPGSSGTGFDSPALLVFSLGPGVQFDWFELGFATFWRTNLVHPANGAIDAGGSHQISIAPYLHLSPPFLPVGISARGGFFSQYADYGIGLSGAMDLVTQAGVTVALTYGF